MKIKAIFSFGQIYFFILIWDNNYSSEIINCSIDYNKTKIMSQMIKGFGHLDVGEILRIPKKEVVIPRFKNLLRNKSFKGVRNSEALNQEVVMMNLMRKLSQAELEEIQRINNRIIRRKFNEMKRRMKKSAQNNSNQKAIQQIFNPNQQNGISLSSCLRNENYEKIDISEKYRTIMINRMSIIQEIKSIEDQKRVYKEEYDNRVNSAARSPNLKKMNFAFRKQNKNKLSEEQLKQFKVMKSLPRFSCHQRILTATPKSNYVSRSKIKQQQKNSLIIRVPK